MKWTPQLKSFFKNAQKSWNDFFFTPLDLYNLGLFRTIFGFSLLGLYGFRALGYRFFFLNEGVLPANKAIEVMPEGFRYIFAFFLPTDWGIRLQLVVHLLLILGLILGLYGRSLTWLLFLVNLGLNQRNPTIIYGADLFSHFWLFYLAFTQHNKYFSVWNIKNPRRMTTIHADLFSTMGVRLIQLQLCISYTYTGFEKLKGAQWWDGSAVWHVIGMEELIPHDLAFMQNVPMLIAIMSMATIIFEVYFSFAIWNKRLRIPWLLVGFMFHLGTAVFLDLWFFFLVMVAPYVLFLENPVTALKRVNRPPWLAAFFARAN